MGEVVQFNEDIKLPYAYASCGDCGGVEFTIETTDEAEPKFLYLHCVACGSMIPAKIQPVFGSKEEE